MNGDRRGAAHLEHTEHATFIDATENPVETALSLQGTQLLQMLASCDMCNTTQPFIRFFNCGFNFFKKGSSQAEAGFCPPPCCWRSLSQVNAVYLEIAAVLRDSKTWLSSGEKFLVGDTRQGWNRRSASPRCALPSGGSERMLDPDRIWQEKNGLEWLGKGGSSKVLPSHDASIMRKHTRMGLDSVHIFGGMDIQPKCQF